MGTEHRVNALSGLDLVVMREGIAKKWVRDEWAQLNEGLDVQKSLSNYMPLIGDIHGAYYNPAVIEQSDASRVDV